MKPFLTAIGLAMAGPAFCLEAVDDDSLGAVAGQRSGYTAKCESISEIDLEKEPLTQSKFLSADALSKLFNEQAPQFDKLYRWEAQANRCLQGSLLFNISINASGAVVFISYRASNQAISRLGGLLVPLISGINFGAVGDRDSFEYLMKFSAY